MSTKKLPNQDEIQARLRGVAAPRSPQEVAWQMQLLIMSARLNVARATRPRPPRLLSPPAARVYLTLQTNGKLSPAQRVYLHREIRQIDDDVVRLIALSRLMPHLPPGEREPVIDEVWRGVNGVGNAAERAALLFRLFPVVDEFQSGPPPSFVAVYNIARGLHNPEARTRSLTALAGHVPDAIRRRMLRAVLDNIAGMVTSARASALVAVAGGLPPELEGRAFELARQIGPADERARALGALAGGVSHDLIEHVQAAALSAIESIVGEETRVEALGHFAPTLTDSYAHGDPRLSFPLEGALRIAMNITRPSNRARALVALAPQLPPELMAEAFAAVNSLTNEREQADCLATLAPQLPPEMLVAAVTNAHTMQQQDARVRALATLARYVPEAVRPQTLLDALAAASNLPNQFERVGALVGLMDLLPDALHEQACTTALEAVRLIDNLNTRARALNMVSEYLPDALLPRALEVANHLSEPQQQFSALMTLATCLPVPEQYAVYERTLTIVAELRYDYRQARALVMLSPQLPPELMPAALALARAIEEPYDRQSALIALAQNTPYSERMGLVGEAWRLLRQIESGYDRASALVALAPLLPKEAKPDLIRAVGAAIAAVHDEYDQASAIILLAPLLVSESPVGQLTLPDKTLVLRDGLRVALRVSGQSQRADLLAEGAQLWAAYYPADKTAIHDSLWGDLLHRIGTLPLADAILCAGALLPVVRHLAGPAGAEALMRAFDLPA